MRQAQVLFKDKLAGTLEETAAGTRFTYDQTWNAEIACCFPTTRREYEWKGLHPFFEHLGPEGWLRERQARVAHIEEQDDFGLLLEFGSDCIGAVGILPAATAMQPQKITEATASPGRTISGIQRKLLVNWNAESKEFRPAPREGMAAFIAKFNSENLPTLVRNEGLCLRWCASVLGKDEVTEFTFGNVSELNERALVVRRFDRTPEGTKLRLEDFAQVLCKPRGRDYMGKYAASYEELAQGIRTYSTRPEIDLARFFRRLVAYALIGNCDAHLKNFSLLETPTGLRLSPVYDVVNSAIYEGYDQRMALEINGEKIYLEQISRTILATLGLSIGIPKAELERIFSRLTAKVKAAKPLLTPPDGEAPDGFMHRFEETVSRSCLNILAN